MIKIFIICIELIIGLNGCREYSYEEKRNARVQTCIDHQLRLISKVDVKLYKEISKNCENSIPEKEK